MTMFKALVELYGGPESCRRRFRRAEDVLDQGLTDGLISTREYWNMDSYHWALNDELRRS